MNDEFSNDIEVFEAENYENEDMKTFEDEEEENLTVEQDDDSTSLVKEDDLTFENQEQEEEITIIEDDVSLEWNLSCYKALRSRWLNKSFMIKPSLSYSLKI